MTTILKRLARTLPVLVALCTASADAKTAPVAPPQNFYTGWTDQFDVNSDVSQVPTAVALDSHGNTVVTGYGFEEGSSETTYFYTAKYDALDGHVVWSGTYTAAGGSAAANAIAIDGSDNVYVGGGAMLGQNEDFFLIKYSGTDGSMLWTQSRDGTADGQDEIRKVITDPQGNVIVTGISAGDSEGLDFLTIKYDTNGNLLWSQRYDLAHQDDVPTGIAADAAGDIFVCGSATDPDQNQVFVTLAYLANGTPTWTGTYTSPDGYYGAAAIAVDSGSNVFTTGHYTDTSHDDGFYTVKYSGTDGHVIWNKTLTSGGIVTSGSGGAKSIALDGNGDVIVAGSLDNTGNGTPAINLAKYSGSNGAQIWLTTDTGTAGGPAYAAKVAIDGANNPVLVGSAFDGALTVQDMYTAKYSQADGHLIWSSTFAGSFSVDHQTGDNPGVDLATDAASNIIALGVSSKDQINTQTTQPTGDGVLGFVTIKNNRFLLETNDPLPADASLAPDPTVFAMDPPALADSGAFAALVTVNSGKAKPTAILTENSGGGLQLPAVQKGPAVDTEGGAYSLFSDPVVSPAGAYAFAAKLAGVPKSMASGVFSNINGSLHLVLQQGVAVPGAAGDTIVSVNSLSMRSTHLLALMTVAAGKTKPTMLLSLDNNLNGTALVQTGQPITLGADATTIKTIAALSPTVLSPGDGRWQGDANSVVKVTTADKKTAICCVNYAGVLIPLLYTGQDASQAVNGAAWKDFGLPGTSPSGTLFSTLGILAPLKGTVTPANNTALLCTTGGTTFSTVALQGNVAVDPSLSGLTFTGFSDPDINSQTDIATIATVAGPGVTAKNKQVLLYSLDSGAFAKVARLGDNVTDISGDADTPTYAGFTSFALASGPAPAPIFTAKIAGAGVTPKNNMGLWAVDSNGAIRRLLRTGDALGTRTVASFTVLKAPSKSFGAARNFNAEAGVALQVVFTDKTEALVGFGIP